VLTASQTDTGQTSGTTRMATVLDNARLLAAINVPAYVAADRSDACPCCPPSRSKAVANALNESLARAIGIFPLDGSASPPGSGTDCALGFDLSCHCADSVLSAPRALLNGLLRPADRLLLRREF
jgi:hypothetical protein